MCDESPSRRLGIAMILHLGIDDHLPVDPPFLRGVCTCVGLAYALGWSSSSLSPSGERRGITIESRPVPGTRTRDDENDAE